MTSRPARPSWGSLGVVAPGSLAFLAAAVMWAGTHDPRAADGSAGAAGPTTTGSTAAGSTAVGGDGAPIGLDSASSVRLARLQVLLGQAEAQLVLLERAAGSSLQAPSPARTGTPPPAGTDAPALAPAAQPSLASPAPLAHATTGASGA